MTVRTAELVMAVLTILMSIALMVKAAENVIGWVPGRGPGAGAWPFWLSAILLGSAVWTLVRWFRGTTPESRNLDAFIDKEALYIVGITFGSLVFLLAATSYVGIYFALLVFVFFYVKVVGGHTWGISIILSIGTPVFIFGLFEYLLTIPLPKGISEPLFYPIYRIIY